MTAFLIHAALLAATVACLLLAIRAAKRATRQAERAVLAMSVAAEEKAAAGRLANVRAFDARGVRR